MLVSGDLVAFFEGREAAAACHERAGNVRGACFERGAAARSWRGRAGSRRRARKSCWLSRRSSRRETPTPQSRTSISPGLRLLERAAKISREDYRQSFLENASENARTLALATTWLDEA